MLELIKILISAIPSQKRLHFTFVQKHSVFVSRHSIVNDKGDLSQTTSVLISTIEYVKNNKKTRMVDKRRLSESKFRVTGKFISLWMYMHYVCVCVCVCVSDWSKLWIYMYIYMYTYIFLYRCILSITVSVKRSISPMFFAQLLCTQIPKAQKESQVISVFLFFLRSARVKAFRKT